MNNSMFVRRCETVLTTMKAKDCQSIRTSEVAKWIEANDATAGQFIAKMCKYNLLKKVGAASLTRYQLTDDCSNSLMAAINEQNDVIKAAAKVVDHFIKRTLCTIPVSVPAVVETNKKPIDAKRKQSIQCLLSLIKENEDLQAEVDLLRDEVTRLQDIENKYNKIIELIKIK